MGTIQLSLQNLTKEAVMRIANGYPPFYPEYIDLGDVDTVPFPIKVEIDIKRSGWVIAVGLMVENLPGSGVLKEALLTLFIDEDGSELTSPNYRPFGKGIWWVHDVIAKSFVAAFPDESRLQFVIALLDGVTKSSKWSITSLDLYEFAKFSSELKQGGETMNKE
jgi:hypothetical protein